VLYFVDAPPKGERLRTKDPRFLELRPLFVLALQALQTSLITLLASLFFYLFGLFFGFHRLTPPQYYRSLATILTTTHRGDHFAIASVNIVSDPPQIPNRELIHLCPSSQAVCNYLECKLYEHPW